MINEKITRRKALGGLGADFAALAVTPVMGTPLHSGTGGDSGMGRAAAIAYAREGADVAIVYYPTEEPDAREVIQFVKSLAKQLGPKGIRVNGVAPGPIWTPLQVSGGATEKKLQQFGGQTPLGRPGQPAEWQASMSSWPATTAAFPMGISTAPPAVRVSHNRLGEASARPENQASGETFSICDSSISRASAEPIIFSTLNFFPSSLL